MKWRNSKERELLSSGGCREQTLPTKTNPHPDLSDVGKKTSDDDENLCGDSSATLHFCLSPRRELSNSTDFGMSYKHSDFSESEDEITVSWGTLAAVWLYSSTNTQLLTYLNFRFKWVCIKSFTHHIIFTHLGLCKIVCCVTQLFWENVHYFVQICLYKFFNTKNFVLFRIGFIKCVDVHWKKWNFGQFQKFTLGKINKQKHISICYKQFH